MDEVQRLATPDWAFWDAVGKVKYSVAVALSLDFDPDLLRPALSTGMALLAALAGSPFTDPACFRSPTEAAQFERRLKLLRTVHGNDGHVHLRDFAKWCAALEIFQPVPAGLHALANLASSEAAPPTAAGDTVEASELNARLRASTGYEFPKTEGAAVPTSVDRAVAAQERAPDRERRVKPPQVSPAQEAEILKAIRHLGHEPKQLSPRRPGKPWVKSEVWRAIGICPLFVSEGVFNKAWDRLRASTAIAERLGL